MQGLVTSHVFVSYASEDRALVGALVQQLEQHGISCWFAHRNIRPGESWPAAISAAIASSGAVLLLLSKDANESRHVAREVELADRAGRPLLPVVPAGVEPSDELKFFLSSVQHLAIDAPLAATAIASSAGDELLRILGTSSPAPAVESGDVRTNPLDFTLWRTYASKHSRVIVWLFYAASLFLLTPPLEPYAITASYMMAAAAGALIVLLTRQLNVPILFTIGALQPLFTLAYPTFVDWEASLFILQQRPIFTVGPTLLVGVACVAGGSAAALQFGRISSHALSLAEWRAWIAPVWGVLHTFERVEATVKGLMFVATAVFWVFYFWLRQ